MGAAYEVLVFMALVTSEGPDESAVLSEPSVLTHKKYGMDVTKNKAYSPLGSCAYMTLVKSV